MEKVVLAIDLGTTGNRVIAFRHDGTIAASSYYELQLAYPNPGWVEQYPMDIIETVKKALVDVVGKVGVDAVEAVGITNQRETTILWDRSTGQPVYNAIVWQCNRTTEWLKQFVTHESMVQHKTGLFLHPYFSASKIRWILDNVPAAQDALKRGTLKFGTVDTWVMWNLTNHVIHATEPSNASRTLLYNLETQQFDPDLLQLFGIPASILPQIRGSDSLFGTINASIVGRELPIMAVLGDQQAALFAHTRFKPGPIKNTFGTGLFLMTSTGNARVPSTKLLSTVAGKIHGEVSYALEGSVFIGGSVIQWLRDGIKIIESSQESEVLARSLSTNEGVYLVPAFTGLGAPYWQPTAKGLLYGITRGTTRNHLVRAALESMAYQTFDVAEAMTEAYPSVGTGPIVADGGASKNSFLMQLCADVLQREVLRTSITESTAFGAASLAGLSCGFWDETALDALNHTVDTFTPQMSVEESLLLTEQWHEVVHKSF